MRSFFRLPSLKGRSLLCRKLGDPKEKEKKKEAHRINSLQVNWFLECCRADVDLSVDDTGDDEVAGF